MAELGIEMGLRKHEDALYNRYITLKQRLFSTEYMHWSASFPGGNDHGPSHIQRVLENLDRILGDDPLERPVVNPYELFLTMMSILYHDVGMLRERRNHAATSALFVDEDPNVYIISDHEKDIISAAVASHSSKVDIQDTCASFSETEHVGGQKVRVRMIAALVRLADELDEDFRRADPLLQERLDLPEESRFFWEFCQRILGIHPHRPSHEIIVNVKFADDDAGRVVCKKEARSFLSLFADKLAKINEQRVIANSYLPEQLRFNRMIVSVRPPDYHETWNRPREFVFTDHTDASEFVAAYPELLIHPAKMWMTEALEAIRKGRFDEARAQLQRLEYIESELPADVRLRIPYNRACVESRLAEGYDRGSRQRRHLLKSALKYIKEWLSLGLEGAWQQTGRTSRNEIFRMGSDGDLRCLLSEWRGAVTRAIPKDLRSALPQQVPKAASGGGGGCIPAGTLIQTPSGSVPIQDLREGTEVLSFDTKRDSGLIATRVTQLHTSRVSKCVHLNRCIVMTHTQPLYRGTDGWIQAGDLTPGMWILDSESKRAYISDVSEIDGYFEVYDLTTDHSTHNYIAYALICQNKDLE